MPFDWNFLSLAFVLALAQGVFWNPAMAADQESPTLEVRLEDSVFLEGQSVYMIACLHNRGSSAIPDVSPLSPRMGIMRVELTRKGTGEHLARTMPTADGTRREGATLVPNGVLCEVQDLTLYFGMTPPDTSSFASRIGETYFPPGEYLLKWRYDLHTGHRNGIPQVTLQGQVEFSVKELISDSQEHTLVSEFLAGLPRIVLDRSPLQAHARAWLPRFYGSKYLLRVYMNTGSLLRDLDFDAIYDGATRAGAPPERRAALLGVRLSMTDYRNKFTAQWKESVRSRAGDQLERNVLSIEPRRP